MYSFELSSVIDKAIMLHFFYSLPHCKIHGHWCIRLVGEDFCEKQHLRMNAYGSGLLVLVDKGSAHNTMTPISPPTNPML